MLQLKLQEFEFIRNNTENIFFVAHRQIRTQNRIQEIVPILRFLLLFRGIFALSRHQ